MFFTRTVKLAIKSLLLHKLRSGLTMLGIVFGVFSVIAMLAIGEGASQQAQDQVLKLGATNIICRSVKPPAETSTQGAASFVLRYGLLESDYRLLKQTAPNVVRTIPIRELSLEARYIDRDMNVRLVGCTGDYVDVNHLKMAAGRFITPRDQEDLANVCVVAHEVAETLFRYENPVGKSLTIKTTGKTESYRIVGVTQIRTASAAVGGSLSGQDFNKDVYIPIETMRVRLPYMQVRRTQGSFSAEETQLNQITLEVEGREDVLPTAEVVRETLNRTHSDKKDIAVVVPLELLKQADQLRMIFNVVLGSVAAISLIVGGIGIMNIMLATVTERTREIGIRRALGAKQQDITRQFLTETVVLAGSGGIIGIVLGLITPLTFGGIQYFVQNWILDGQVAGSELGRIFSDMQPRVAFWTLPLAFGISVGIGIIFGLYPARSAARLDPIEALRHE